jgi:hypothetical protein
MKVHDGWMEAYALTDTWSPAGTVPEGAETALKQAIDANEVDLPNEGPVPAVYVSTTPAELIVTDGEPQFVPVDGTSLLYVSNTTVHVFKEPTDRELYVLASGRWYRSWTTNGPWEYVAEEELPRDFREHSRQRQGAMRPCLIAYCTSSAVVLTPSSSMIRYL